MRKCCGRRRREARADQNQMVRSHEMMQLPRTDRPRLNAMETWRSQSNHYTSHRDERCSPREEDRLQRTLMGPKVAFPESKEALQQLMAISQGQVPMCTPGKHFRE